jgi:putative membrane protein insertion efficiency factor
MNPSLPGHGAHGGTGAANPYSALALYPVLERHAGEPQPEAGSKWPWWLNPLAWFAVGFILAYRHLLPGAWKRHCIYSPTCSLYGLRSIQKYGLLRGVARTWARIRRCNGVLFLGGPDEP